MTNKLKYSEVQSDNWQNNSGNGDVDPLVMQDLGYTLWSDLHDTVSAGLDTLKPERPQNLRVAEAAGRILCGDCAQVFPCAHGDGIKTKGY